MMGLQASGATENPSSSERTFVVVISPVDLSGDLGLTVLWRNDVQRVMVTTVEAAIEVARVRPATMFVVGGLEPAQAATWLRRLRADAATRTSALAVLCTEPDLDQEEPLRAAGANVVLPTPVDPEIWDGRLDRLLRVPRRRSTRIPVRLSVWSRRSADPEPIEGVMLNVSANGMLLETAQPLPVGARFDLSFRLPRDLSEVHAIGRVVREVAQADSPRFGVEFVVLRADGRDRIASFVEGRRRPRRSLNAEQETSEFEAELRALSARESAILDSALDSILVLDQEGRILEFNRAAEETFGYRKAEVIGRPAAETIVPHRLRESHRLGFLRRQPGIDDLGLNRRTETVALRADGREVAVELAVTAALDRGVKVYTVYLRDISERKRVEREQAAEHATLRILSESSSLGEAAAPLLETLCTAHGWDLGTIWIRDDNVGAVRCVSLWRAPGVQAPELEALEGDVFFPVGTGLVGRVSRTGEAMWVEDLANDATFPRMRLAAKRGMVSLAAIPVLVGRECLGIIELYARTRRPDDQELRTRLTAVGRQLGLFQDRRRAEKALRAREERFRALVENGSDVTVLVDADGRVKYASGPVRRILGRAPEELVGHSAFDFMPPEDAAEMRPKLEAALARPGQPVTATYRMLHGDGSWRVLESIVVSHRNNPAIRAIVINSRDVTERHALEEQLRQSQKMEAVGRLAGGIAHDFNNLLAVMLGYTTLTLSRANDPSAVTRNLEHIRTAAERAANLTRQLLTFSRKQVLQPRVVELGAVVSELHTMLERLIGEDVELVTDVGRAEGHIKADRGQLEQVIVNLAVNARDAMPRGGRLAIVMRNVVVDAALAREQPGLGPGRHVRIEVSDNGVRHGAGNAEPRVRAVLQHQGDGQRHGAGAGHGLRDRQAERRADRGRERARARHHLPHLASGGRDRNAAGGARARPECRARGIGDGPPRRRRRGRARPAARGADRQRVQGAAGLERGGGAAREPCACRSRRPASHRRGHAGHGRPRGRHPAHGRAPRPARALRVGVHRGGHRPPGRPRAGHRPHPQALHAGRAAAAGAGEVGSAVGGR